MPEIKKSVTFIGAQRELVCEIVRARKAAGLSKEGLSDEMQCDRQHIDRIESSRSNPTLLTLIRIQIATGKKLKILFE